VAPRLARPTPLDSLQSERGSIEHSWTGDAEHEFIQILRFLRDSIDGLPGALQFLVKQSGAWKSITFKVSCCPAV